MKKRRLQYKKNFKNVKEWASISVPRELHTMIKLECVAHRITIGAFLEKAVMFEMARLKRQKLDNVVLKKKQETIEDLMEGG